MTGGGQMVKKSRVVFTSINQVSLSDVGILKVCPGLRVFRVERRCVL